MDFSKPFRYEPNTGRWVLELHKAPKDFCAQCGIKVSIEPGFPTGDEEPFYKSNSKSGLKGSCIEIRCFDNLSGWTSAVTFDFNTFVEKIIEMMPKDKVRCETFVLAKRDLEVSKMKKGEENNG